MPTWGTCSPTGRRQPDRDIASTPHRSISSRDDRRFVASVAYVAHTENREDRLRSGTLLCSRGNLIGERSYQPITKVHLELLAKYSRRELEAFFHRDEEASAIYRDRFLAAALCLGAARHYLDGKFGVKDFDVYFFFAEHPERDQKDKRVKRSEETYPGFGEVQTDFIRIIVRSDLVKAHRSDPEVLLKAYLKKPPADTARKLAESPVVGLVPDAILGKVLWQG